MLSLNQINEKITQSSIIFYKLHCPFCIASEKLMNELKFRKIIQDFEILVLDRDFTNQILKEILFQFGWKPEPFQQFPTKPQIFINFESKINYIGGNREFYKSKWNLGENEGRIQVSGKKIECPQFINAMSF